MRRGRVGPTILSVSLAIATPMALAAAGSEEEPVATGLEYASRGAAGARISTRLERLSTRDWEIGPLAIRPFARAIVEDGQVTVRRPIDAQPEPRAPVPAAPDPDREGTTAALHRLAEGLAGRELVAFRIHRFAFAAFRGDERQLAIEAREADVQRNSESLELHDLRAETRLGQRLEAKRARLRWDPERLAVRGPYRLCDGNRCERGDGLELAFEASSGRLVPAAVPAGAGGSGAASPAREPGEHEQRGGK